MDITLKLPLRSPFQFLQCVFKRLCDGSGAHRADGIGFFIMLFTEAVQRALNVGDALSETVFAVKRPESLFFGD